MTQFTLNYQDNLQSILDNCDKCNSMHGHVIAA